MFVLAFTPDGRRLVSPNVGGETLVWDVTRTGSSELEAIATQGGPHFGFVMAPDGERVGVLTTRPQGPVESGGFEVLDLSTGGVLMELVEERTDIPFSRYPSPDFTLVGSLSVDNRGTIRQIPSTEVVAELEPCFNAVAFSPDNTLVLVNRNVCDWGTRGRSRVIRVDNGEPVLELPLSWVSSATFNPAGIVEAGRYLVITDQDVVHVWDMRDGSQVGEITMAEVGVFSSQLHVIFDPTGRFLAVGSTDGRVWVADMEQFASGDPLEDAIVFNTVAHTGPAPRPSITSDGRLATAGFDGLVRIWDVRSGEMVVEFRNGAGQGPIVAFAPDGSFLLYPDEAGTMLRRFYVDQERLVDLARSRLTRDLSDDECLRFLGTDVCET